MALPRNCWFLCFKRLLTSLLLFCSCIDIGQALIEGPFNVKSPREGEGRGGCDDLHKAVLDKAF